MGTTRQRIAEAFPPGDFLKEELEARGWNQADLAEIIDRSPRLVNEIASGSRGISIDTAEALAEAFNTSAAYWLNLQQAYDLWKRSANRDDAVSRRAVIYSYAPIREMVKRGWIESSESVDVLEERVRSFFGVESLNEKPRIFARLRSSLSEATPSQLAWLCRAAQLARSVPIQRSYSEPLLDSSIEKLRKLMHAPEEVRHVPRILSEAGVRFVVVEHLPKTHIDGACFWMTKGNRDPVIALSVRYDRIDWFWHTLLHECGHVKYRHTDIDIDLLERSRDEEEEATANRFAQETLIPQSELTNFIDRVRPLYSHERILGFARVMGVHPGIVVGQLQHRGELNFSHSRKMLAKIRDFVISSALSDGWGSMLPANF